MLSGSALAYLCGVYVEVVSIADVGQGLHGFVVNATSIVILLQVPLSLALLDTLFLLLL